jgi:phospholipid transport system substrate-binding protein
MRLINIKRIVMLLFVLSCVTGSPDGALARGKPLDQVRQSVDEIMVILNDPRFSKPEMRQERDERLMVVVRKRFNFTEMARLALARHWREITPDEREQFTELFANLLRNTYISRVEAYYEQEVKISFQDQEIRDGRANVTSIVTINGTGTPVDYRLTENNGEWLVYDVVIEGVSLIRNYRTQFSRIMEKEKFAGLIRRMEEKINSGETS